QPVVEAIPRTPAVVRVGVGDDGHCDAAPGSEAPSLKDAEPTVVVPTTTDWDGQREGGTEKFIRSLAHEASLRHKPVEILSTGTHAVNNGSVKVRPVIPAARSEFAYIRALRRKLRAREVSLPGGAVVLANAE